ncbi:hypothetical protein [Bacillus sp. FJAT-44742]|uniref:hypothetical protein n=1 Tax=Bacillus sp. FJAT-44742 TaxID=2014005 RepID=UPI000C24723C|nr:hypothetical protein [Bacillus sp. FJAT-44742]
MISKHEYLTPEDIEKLENLQAKVKDVNEVEDLKRYTTQMTIIYEKARLRNSLPKDAQEN